jgi:hypothetical protein
MSDEGNKLSVIVTDIHMPFWSMVIFMVKWALASIPALIILTLIAAIAWRLLTGIDTKTVVVVGMEAPLSAQGNYLEHSSSTLDTHPDLIDTIPHPNESGECYVSCAKHGGRETAFSMLEREPERGPRVLIETSCSSLQRAIFQQSF